MGKVAGESPLFFSSANRSQYSHNSRNPLARDSANNANSAGQFQVMTRTAGHLGSPFFSTARFLGGFMFRQLKIIGRRRGRALLAAVMAFITTLTGCDKKVDWRGVSTDSTDGRRASSSDAPPGDSAHGQPR